MKNFLKHKELGGLALSASLAPLAVATLLLFLVFESHGFFLEGDVKALLASIWKPLTGDYGVIPLTVATVLTAFIAAVISVLLGTPAAIRLALSAGRREAAVCESALAVMSGLPSVIVGLVGLAWLTPTMGFSVLTGVLTLTVMIMPTYTLILASGLQQQGRRLFNAGLALGMTERSVIYGPVLRAMAPTMVSAALLAFGRGLGEATAVSLVIGNITQSALPGLFDTANTLSTAILKDHAAASGIHHDALYVVALILTCLVLANSVIGLRLSRLARRKAGV